MSKAATAHLPPAPCAIRQRFEIKRGGAFELRYGSAGPDRGGASGPAWAIGFLPERQTAYRPD